MLRRQDLIRKLRRQTAVYFKNKGYAVSSNGYILVNRDNWQDNIILPEVVTYIVEEIRHREQTENPFPLHKWIHHGLSSQACLFNLLGEFVVKQDYPTIKEIISLSEPELKLAGNISIAQFEYEDRDVFAEYQGQPTSIDLVLGTDRDEKVFIEFKFTEAEFGTCSVYEDGDCDGSNPKDNLNTCYLHQIGRTYMDLMNNYDLLSNIEHCPFTEFYQAYRLLGFTLKNSGYLLLIHDERNPSFLAETGGIKRGKYQRFRRLLPKEVADKIHILGMQRILEYLEEYKSLSWLAEFREKYH